MFDTFGSQNFPSNPSVPPSAPPGFSAPSSAANPAKVSPPMTSAQIASLQSALQDNNIAQIVQAVTGAYAPSGGTAFSQLESWANGIYGDISGYVESLASSLTGIETAAWNDITDVFTDVENWAKQLFGSFQQLQTWWNSLINGLLGSSGGGTGTVYDLTLWLQNAETNAANAWTAIEDFLHTGDWSDLSTAWQDIIQAIFGSSTSTGLWGWIPSTAVTSQTQNPQPVSNFPNSASIVGGRQVVRAVGSVGHVADSAADCPLVVYGWIESRTGNPGDANRLGGDHFPGCGVGWLGYDLQSVHRPRQRGGLRADAPRRYGGRDSRLGLVG
jgi:hypothetical protein